MNIVDRRPENYYELDVTIDGVKRKYIPLGNNRYWIGENLPRECNSKESWLDMFHNGDAATGLLAILFQIVYVMDWVNEEEHPIMFELFANPIFLSLCEKYIDFQSTHFNFDIFMNNCQDVDDYSVLAEFGSLEDDDAYYEEEGKVFEIVNSKGNHILNESAFQDFLIDQRYLEDFEKDYRDCFAFRKLYSQNK